MGEGTILKLQEEARQAYLYLAVAVLVCYNASLGSCWVYGGLTLEHHLQGDQGFLTLTQDQGSWYMSIVPILNMLGTLAGFPLGERLGRRNILVLSTLLNLVGFLVMYLSSSFLLLCLGRAVSTFGLGAGVMVPFVLISEITTIRARAPLSVVNILSLTVGIFVTYIFVFLFPPSLLIFFSSGLSLLFLLLAPLLPESPHFLVRRGRKEEARRVYRKLRGNGYPGVEAEVEEVEEVTASAGTSTPFLARWSERSFLQPLAILVTLMGLISLNGVDCPLNFYGPGMFADFGFSLPPKLMALVIPSGQLLGYCLAPWVMTVLSKRLQYTLATGGMCLACLGLALAYHGQATGFQPSLAPQAGMAISCLVLTTGYGFGMGSVSYAMPGELLGPEDKTLGISIAQCVRMLGTSAVLKVYPSLVSSLGSPILFLLHAAALAAATVFVIWFLPETRNKSLSEIQQLFGVKPKTETPAQLSPSINKAYMLGRKMSAPSTP